MNTFMELETENLPPASDPSQISSDVLAGDSLSLPVTPSSDNVQVSTPAASSYTSPDVFLYSKTISRSGDRYSFIRAFYADPDGINSNSISTGDLYIANDRGFKQTATLIAANPSVDQRSWLAFYGISPPGGVWDATDNGTYHIVIAPNEVLNNNGIPLKSGEVGTFTVAIAPDLIPPTASLTTLPTSLDQDETTYTFTVTYSDDQGLDATTLDNRDIRVKGPNGFDQLATLVAIARTDNKSYTTTYSIKAPGDSWDTTDNGDYTISIEPNQIGDTSQNQVASSVLKRFNVSVDGAGGPPTYVRTFYADPRGADEGTVESAEFSPDGQLLATGPGDGQLRIFRVSDGSLVRQIDYWDGMLQDKRGEVESVAFSPDGQFVAAGGNGPGIRVYRVSDGSLVTSIRSPETDGMAFSPYGPYFAAARRERLVVYNTTTWKPYNYRRPISHTNGGINSVDFTPDGKYVVTGAPDGLVKISQLSDGTLVRAIQAANRPGSVKSVRLSPDGTLFATANGKEAVVRVFRVADGALVATLPQGTTYMEAVAFSPDGRYLATAGEPSTGTVSLDDRSFKLYRVSDFSLAYQVVAHDVIGIEYLDFSADGKYLVSASEDGTAKLWKIPSHSVQFTPLSNTTPPTTNGLVVGDVDSSGVPVADATPIPTPVSDPLTGPADSLTGSDSGVLQNSGADGLLTPSENNLLPTDPIQSLDSSPITPSIPGVDNPPPPADPGIASVGNSDLISSDQDINNPTGSQTSTTDLSSGLDAGTSLTNLAIAAFISQIT
jgi:WD40 repeat protein